jgi:phosphonate transport system permease protein
MEMTVQARLRRRGRWSIALPLALLAYLALAAVALDIPGALGRMRLDNVRVLLGDFVSYKVHVIAPARGGAVSANIDGDARDTLPRLPDWVAGQLVDLGKGERVTFTPTGLIHEIPGYGALTVTRTATGLELAAPGPLPDWVSASDTKVTIVTPGGRVQALKARSEVWRYFPGWAGFFFPPDSPYGALGWGEILGRAVTGEAGAMAEAFWTNRLWHHGKVVAAMGETVLMAVLGTISGALIALPLAFLAARGIMPFSPLRFALRRLFDFIRGTDALIWTLLLLRAFGPGPMTGALAMLITDTGLFGKLFSETLENIDRRPIEGLRSTGAGPLQRARFAILPQILPVFLAQLLYTLESNTRSATMIGALVGGGIGLLLTQAIQTQKDWEDVGYYLTLIILTVMAMDALSGRLRARLIKGKP